MAKRTQGQGFQTPNEKYNAEFGQETAASKVKQSEQNKVQENFQTPNEKYNEEFGVENTGQTGQVGQAGRVGKFQK